MATRRLSSKLSLRGLKAKFKKDDSESDYEEDHLIPRPSRASSRLSIRSETRENTRRNSQVSTTSSQGRQFDSGANKSELRIKLPFMSIKFSKSSAGLAPAPNEEPSRTRSRSSTLESHVQGHRGEYDTAPPETRGYYPLNRPQHYVNVPLPRYMGRQDSVPQEAQEEVEEVEEVEYEEYSEERHEVNHHEERAQAARPASPAGSAASHDTIRRRIASPPPPRPRAPSPHARRRGHEDSERDAGDRRDDRDGRDDDNRRPSSSARIDEGRSSRIGHRPDRRPSECSQNPPSTGQPPRRPSNRPPNFDIHPAFRNPNSTLDVARAQREPRVDDRTDNRTDAEGSRASSRAETPSALLSAHVAAESSLDPDRPFSSSPSPSFSDYVAPLRTTSQQPPGPPNPHPRYMGLRRQRGVHFREPQRPRRESVGQSWSAYERPLSPRSDPERQGPSFPRPIPEQQFDQSRLLWSVGSEMCRRVEREEIWRATTPNGERKEGEKKNETRETARENR